MLFRSVATLVVIVPALIGGWYFFRERIRVAALERNAITGRYPVVAERPPREDDEA